MADLTAYDFLPVLRLAAAGKKLFDGYDEGVSGHSTASAKMAAHTAYMARADLVRAALAADYIDPAHQLTARGRAFLEQVG